MAKFSTAILDLGQMDRLSCRESPIHRLDPRSKLITTLFFVATVISFNKHEISALVPFFIYPLILITLGNLPLKYFLRKILLVAPFALFIGIFNPLLDRDVLIQLGPVGISGGWVSFLSILIRFVLTVSAGLILIACTGFNAICMGLEKIGAPRIFAVQLLFLYRYLFVLIEETLRVVNAWALRSFQKRRVSIRVFGYLLGHLLLRTLDRAHRIQLAMFCRGFTGEIHVNRPAKIRRADVKFMLAWSAVFVFFRVYNLPKVIGALVTEIFL
ncbi:MAG: cobalt ECF transporter T component CbiQ [Desulfobacterales bacterium]|nr:cobalt ECF transporter T component CbiQ [Desulfobacterales bacterium]